MCPEHSIHEFLIHIGISARTHAGFISEVMSSVNPEGSLITSCKGTGDPMGWKVSAIGGRTNVRLPHAAFGVPVIRLNGSVIVTGVVKLAMIRLPSLDTLKVVTSITLCIIGFQIGVPFQSACICASKDESETLFICATGINWSAAGTHNNTRRVSEAPNEDRSSKLLATSRKVVGWLGMFEFVALEGCGNCKITSPCSPYAVGSVTVPTAVLFVGLVSVWAATPRTIEHTRHKERAKANIFLFRKSPPFELTLNR